MAVVAHQRSQNRLGVQVEPGCGPSSPFSPAFRAIQQTPRAIERGSTIREITEAPKNLRFA
jgi:hypothetical protein